MIGRKLAERQAKNNPADKFFHCCPPFDYGDAKTEGRRWKSREAKRA